MLTCTLIMVISTWPNFTKVTLNSILNVATSLMMGEVCLKTYEHWTDKQKYFYIILKNPACLYYSTFFLHTLKNEAGCSNGSWNVDYQRGNLARVTSKIATSHTGQL